MKKVAITQSLKKNATTNERRRTRRRPVLASFFVSVVIPKKGLHKLEIHNLSEDGIGFNLDIEGESSSYYPVQVEDSVDIRLYLNHSLFIPLVVQITRIEEKNLVRHVGAKFRHKKSPAFRTFLALLNLLDTILEEIQIDRPKSSD